MTDKILQISTLIEEFDSNNFSIHSSFYLQNDIKPSLAAILTSQERGCISYMKGIKNFCAENGVVFSEYSADSADDLNSLIDKLNKDRDTHGVMIMYPTPFEDRDTQFMNRLSPHKDVEGLNCENLGYLVQYERFRDLSGLRKFVIPPTAKGILYILKRYSEIYENIKQETGNYPDKLVENPFTPEGKKITVINDSLAVGRSLSLMLLNENASVQICHQYTDFGDIVKFISNSDIVISAVPYDKFIIPADSVKPGSVCIDISFEGNFEYPEIFRRAYKTAPLWSMVQKGNRINDMTLNRLLSNLYYLINSSLSDSLLHKLNNLID